MVRESLLRSVRPARWSAQANGKSRFSSSASDRNADVTPDGGRSADRIKAAAAADEELNKLFPTKVAEVAVAGIDRARDGAKFVQTAATAIFAIYTGLLALGDRGGRAAVTGGVGGATVPRWSRGGGPAPTAASVTCSSCAATAVSVDTGRSAQASACTSGKRIEGRSHPITARGPCTIACPQCELALTWRPPHAAPT